MDQFADPFFGEAKHLEEFIFAERGPFCGALHLNNFSGFGHYKVGINFSGGVLEIAEIENRNAFVNADADGGEAFGHRILFNEAFFHQAFDGQSERNIRAGDGGGAGPAVGLNDVAVEIDLASAQFLKIDDGAQRASDEALNLHGASADFALRGLAFGAVLRGRREHAVFCGHPSTGNILEAHPAGYTFFHAGGADDAGVAHLHQHGAFG